MMRDLPLGIDDRALAYLDNAIAGSEANILSGFYQLHMCPLVAMIVNVISDFREQYTFIPQYAMGFPHEGRVCVGECVAVFLRGPFAQAEPLVEILGTVTPLVGNVRWIIYYDIK